MSPSPETNVLRAEIQDGLSKARDAVFGDDAWHVITYRKLEPLVDAVLELGQHFEAGELLVLGTYVAAMARQNIAE